MNSSTRLTIILNELKNKDNMDDELYYYLHCNTNIVPNFYSLPEIHKQNCPLRPIMSFIDSPINDLSK